MKTTKNKDGSTTYTVTHNGETVTRKSNREYLSCAVIEHPGFTDNKLTKSRVVYSGTILTFGKALSQFGHTKAYYGADGFEKFKKEVTITIYKF